MVASLFIVGTSTFCGGCGDAECSGSAFSGGPVACGSAGTFDRTVCVEGKLRKFREYVPPALVCDDPPPLVVFLHGNGGDETSGDVAQAIADELGFVYVSLRGVDQGDHLGFGPEDVPNSRDFAVRVVDQVRREFPTDPKFAVLTGFSGGAFFASYCITWMHDRLAGVGVFGAGIAESWMSEFAATPVKMPVVVRVGDRDSLRSYANSLVSQLQSTGWPPERIDFKVFEGGHEWDPAMIRDTFNWAKSF